jgi:hypothetical protein
MVTVREESLFGKTESYVPTDEKGFEPEDPEGPTMMSVSVIGGSKE